MRLYKFSVKNLTEKGNKSKKAGSLILLSLKQDLIKKKSGIS